MKRLCRCSIDRVGVRSIRQRRSPRGDSWASSFRAAGWSAIESTAPRSPADGPIRAGDVPTRTQVQIERGDHEIETCDALRGFGARDAPMRSRRRDPPGARPTTAARERRRHRRRAGCAAKARRARGLALRTLPRGSSRYADPGSWRASPDGPLVAVPSMRKRRRASPAASSRKRIQIVLTYAPMASRRLVYGARESCFR